jgi:protein-arginine kinase activator protein McsA
MKSIIDYLKPKEEIVKSKQESILITCPNCKARYSPMIHQCPQCRGLPQSQKPSVRKMENGVWLETDEEINNWRKI